MGITLAIVLLFAAPEGVDKFAQTIERNAKLPYEQGDRERAIFALGRIGSPQSTRLLIGLLDDEFEHQRDNAVSALISLKKKSAAERAPSIQLLAKALRTSRSAETRRHIATAMGLMRDPTVAAPLASALGKEKNPRAAEAMAIALGRVGGAVAAVALRKAVEGRPVARASAIRALGFQSGEADFVRKFADDRDDAVRAAVVDALIRLGSENVPVGDPGVLQGVALADALARLADAAVVRKLAESLLTHSSWRVRSAAIAGVEKRRDAALLDLLVVRLDQERGRLRHDAWMALRHLTGKDVPPDAEQWRALGVLRIVGEQQPSDAPVKETKTAAYFGLPIVSERIAFVFDVSGSMRDDRKIEIAREKFAETVADLDAQQRYDLFVYRYLLDYPPRPRLERAHGKLVAGKTRKARAWLGKQPAKGGGAIYDALLAAMDDPEVDTIYLLSDGVPSYGTIKRDYRVLQEIRSSNRWRRVAIHTILLGSKGTDRKFMRNLAHENGGMAVGADGRPLR